MAFLYNLIEFDYLRRTLLAVLLASLASGLVGSYVVVRRQSYMIGAISHSLLGGIGLARYLQTVHGIHWFTPLVGALVAALLAAIAISVLTQRNRFRQDIVLSAVWSLGVAAGLTAIAFTPGYAEDLNSYLFGSILLVAKHDIVIMTMLVAVIVLVILAMHNQFIALCFNEEMLALRGISTARVSFILHLLIAITVVILAQVVGIVLVLVLLVIPTATVATFTNSFLKMMVGGTLVCMAFCITGLLTSYQFDLPTGATIVEIAVATYLVASLAKLVFVKPGQRKT